MLLIAAVLANVGTAAVFAAPADEGFTGVWVGNYGSTITITDVTGQTFKISADVRLGDSFSPIVMELDETATMLDEYTAQVTYRDTNSAMGYDPTLILRLVGDELHLEMKMPNILSGNEFFDVGDVAITSKYLRSNSAALDAPASAGETVRLPAGTDVTVDWDADMFADYSVRYNHALGTAAAAMSEIAYDKDTIRAALSDMGFDNVETYNYDDYDREAGRWSENQNDKVAFCIAHKVIYVGEEKTPYNLIAVIVRGTQGDEWYSNFRLVETGSQNDHTGFAVAKNYVNLALTDFIGTYIETDNPRAGYGNKFFVTGHSRGAAVANLLAADLTRDELWADQKDIYAYTFATPNVTQKAEARDASEYGNIFNFVNAEDFVPFLPGSAAGWGYWKYGITLMFPGYLLDESFSTYYKPLFDNAYSRLGGQEAIKYDYQPGHLYRAWSCQTVLDVALNLRQIAPTVSKFYSVEYPLAYTHQIKKLSPHGFFTHICDIRAEAPNMGWAVAELGLLAANQDEYFGKLANFFVGNSGIAVFNNNLYVSHDGKSYLAWMLVTDGWQDMHDYETHCKRARIACPVDIEVYDSAGNLAGRIVDNAVDESVDSGLLIYVEGDVKYIYLPAYGTYTINFTGTDAGEMTYTVEDISIATAETVQQQEFAGVTLEAGKTFTGAVSQEEPAELYVTRDGVRVLKVLENGEETAIPRGWVTWKLFGVPVRWIVFAVLFTVVFSVELIIFFAIRNRKRA